MLYKNQSITTESIVLVGVPLLISAASPSLYALLTLATTTLFAAFIESKKAKELSNFSQIEQDIKDLKNELQAFKLMRSM